MRITKDTPADSHVETMAAHYEGEWIDSLVETSSGMIAQTLRDALSPETPEAMRARMWPTLDRPDAELREERGLWSGPVEFRRVISRGPLVSVCAWCTPGVGGANVTHGICEKHKAAMMAEVHAYAAKQHAA